MILPITKILWLPCRGTPASISCWPRPPVRLAPDNPSGGFPSGNPSTVPNYTTSPAPSVQELRELMEVKQELTQMYQRQNAQLVQATAEQP